MKKNEIYEGTVNSLKFPNKGQVFVPTEEENVMVKNTLPGQKVQFRPVKINILKKNKRIIQVFRIPDISHPVFKKKGVYNGHVTLDEDLLLFVS